MRVATARRPHSARWGTLARSSAALVLVMVIVTSVIIPVLGTASSAAGRAMVRNTFASQAPVLGNTLLLGVSQATLTLVLACLCAGGRVFDQRGQRVVHLVLLLPLVLPGWTMAVALVGLLGHQGLLGSHLPLSPYGLAGLALAGSLQALPVSYLLMLSAIRNIDPDRADQARSLGRGTLRSLVDAGRRPLIAGGVAAFLGAYAEAITDLANPLVLGGGFPVLASRVHSAVMAEYDLAGASVLVCLLALPTLVLLALSRLFDTAARTSRRSSRSLESRPARSRPERLLVLAGRLVALVIVSMLVVVVLGSLGVEASRVRPSLDHIRHLATGTVLHELGTSLLVTIGSIAVASLVSLVLVGSSVTHPCGRWMLTVIEWFGSLPGLFIGLAGLLFVDRVGDSLGPGRQLGEATAVALVFCASARVVPSMVRTMRLALERTPSEVIELDRVSGHGFIRRWRTHLWPRLVPALGQVQTTSALRILTAVNTVALLTNSHVGLLAVSGLRRADAGQTPEACAMALLLAGVGLVIVLTCRPVLERGA